MATEIRFFEGTGKKFFVAMQVRQAVFIDEQGVAPELERDEFDAVSTHALLYADGKIVGTGRYFTDAEDCETARLGRVAVLQDSRARGYGELLMRAMLEKLRGNKGFKRVLIHAQKRVVAFYERMGFKAFGGEFEEAGIIHVEMVLDLIT